MEFESGDLVRFYENIYEFVCYKATRKDLCVLKKSGIQLVDIPVNLIEGADHEDDADFQG